MITRFLKKLLQLTHLHIYLFIYYHQKYRTLLYNNAISSQNTLSVAGLRASTVMWVGGQVNRSRSEGLMSTFTCTNTRIHTNVSPQSSEWVADVSKVESTVILCRASVCAWLCVRHIQNVNNVNAAVDKRGSVSGLILIPKSRLDQAPGVCLHLNKH